MIKLPSIRNLILAFLLFSLSCVKGLQQQIIVYNNDFEDESLSNITGGLVSNYNNSNVLGRYNNGGFNLELDNLQKHDLVIISLDLYIHDSWDGNLDPDIWQMKVDGAVYINTTFYNLAAPCTAVNCLPQSYPNNYLNSNHNPGSGSSAMFLPGACSSSTVNATTLYKIQKTIRHNGRSLSLECVDFLKQDVADKLCDESWSIDNLVIKTIKLD